MLKFTLSFFNEFHTPDFEINALLSAFIRGTESFIQFLNSFIELFLKSNVRFINI